MPIPPPRNNLRIVLAILIVLLLFLAAMFAVHGPRDNTSDGGHLPQPSTIITVTQVVLA